MKQGEKKGAEFVDRAGGWRGQFEGDSRLLVGEIIAAYYNGSSLKDSTFDVVKERATISPAATKSDLAVIADIMRIESYFHFPVGCTPHRAVEELEEQRTGFCGALRWLCSPKIAEPAVSAEELEALLLSGKRKWGRYPEIDQNSELFVAYFEDHGMKHFKRHLYLRNGHLLSIWLPDHLIDLFCVFLLTECEGKTPEQMPFKFCLKCEKLFFTDLEGDARVRKQFCSTVCQQTGHWTKTNRARSDAGFVERLLENNSEDLRKRLANPAVQERFARIKRDWQGWPTLMNKVKEIDALAK